MGPDNKQDILKVFLNPNDRARMNFLVTRLGITHEADVVRYCMSQVTYWIMSAPIDPSNKPNSKLEIGGEGRGIG